MNYFATVFLPLLLAFVLSYLAFPPLIRYFRKKQLGQVTLEDGPTWHEEKSGTPTMGGVNIIIFTLTVVSIVALFNNLFNWQLATLMFLLSFYGFIGFIDDFIKLFMKRNLGLSSKQKFLLQILGGLIVVGMLWWYNWPTVVHLPVIQNWSVGLLFYLFIVFWIVGFSNATNLTDGIDGLLGSTASIAYAAYGVIALTQKQWSLVLFSWAVVGSLLAFLLFNKKPAKIFMGDVGSLALGAGLAGLSILLQIEWSLLLIGFIFVIETASVMIQVFYFKRTGKRIFKMTPIHHHFEMSDWSENKIVLIFSLITILFSGISLLIIS